MKKLLSYLLVIALVLVQFTPLVSAAEIDADNNNKGSLQAGTKGTINITNTLEGKTYSIYQVLELESFDDDRNAYTYNAASDAWNTFLNSAAIKDIYLSYDATTGVWTWVEDADAQAFAQLALAYAETNDIKAVASKKSNKDNEVVKFEELELGYYLVDSTAGALCNLTTTHAETTIAEKNAVPSVDKTVEEDSNGVYGDNNTADMNQEVNFKTTINVETGAENYVLVDVMSAGLKLNETSFVLKHADGTEVPTDAYDIYTTGDKLNVNFDNKAAVATFVIEFNNEYMASLRNETEEGDTQIDERDIIVEYSAVVTKDAVVELEGNPNETWLEYGDNNESNKDITRTYTLSFDVIKIDAQGGDLTGAEFELHTSATENSPISFVELTDEEGNVIGYRKATSADTVTTTIIKVGSANIEGLDAATYYLEETKAPEGYNKLTSRITVVVGTTMNGTTINAVVEGTNDQIVTYANDDVTIKNFTGALLPSTGGMGTVLFVTIGSIMVMGFGVLLVTKLRMSKMTI